MESAVGGVCVCIYMYVVTSYTIVKFYAAFILLIGMSHFYISEIQQTATLNEVILIHQTYQSAWLNSEYFDACIVYTFPTT